MKGDCSKFFLWTLFSFLLLLTGFEKSDGLSASFIKRDDVISAQIKAKIIADPILSQRDLVINASDAVVSIQGQVNTVAEAKHIVILVNSIAGVKSVDVSRLRVKQLPLKPGQKKEIFSADSFITSLIIGLYIREGLIEENQPETTTVSVETKDGIVYLRGAVATETAVTQAIDLAQTIPGVIRVQSTLTTTK